MITPQSNQKYQCETQQWSVEIYGTLSNITTFPTPPVSPFPSPTLRIWLQYIPSIREINVFCGLPGTMNRLHGNGAAAVCVVKTTPTPHINSPSPLSFSLFPLYLSRTFWFVGRVRSFSFTCYFLAAVLV